MAVYVLAQCIWPSERSLRVAVSLRSDSSSSVRFRSCPGAVIRRMCVDAAMSHETCRAAIRVECGPVNVWATTISLSSSCSAAPFYSPRPLHIQAGELRRTIRIQIGWALRTPETPRQDVNRALVGTWRAPLELKQGDHTMPLLTSSTLLPSFEKVTTVLAARRG